MDIGVTAEQVRLLAGQVNAQIEGVNVDVTLAAASLGASWSLRTGTAWLAFLAAWKQEYAQAIDNGWMTFGLGAAYDRIRSYQESARDWQKKIAAMSGRPSSIPEITPNQGGGPLAIPWTPIAVLAGIGLAFYLGIPQAIARRA